MGQCLGKERGGMSHPHPHLPLLLTLCNPTGSAMGRGVGTGWAVLPITSTSRPLPCDPMGDLGLSVFLDSLRAKGVLYQISGETIGDYEVPGCRVCPHPCETFLCVHPRLAPWAHMAQCRGEGSPTHSGHTAGPTEEAQGPDQGGGSASHFLLLLLLSSTPVLATNGRGPGRWPALSGQEETRM